MKQKRVREKITKIKQAFNFDSELWHVHTLISSISHVCECIDRDFDSAFSIRRLAGWWFDGSLADGIRFVYGHGKM